MRNLPVLRFLIALICAATQIAVIPNAHAAQQSQIGLNQKVLVIPVKFADKPNTRMTGAQWITTLTSQVNLFYSRATHGKTTFRFERPTGVGVPADGWFPLTVNQADWPGTTQGARLAIAAADPFVNMANYNRVLVITNAADEAGNFLFGAQTTGYQWMPVNEGDETTQIINGNDTRVRLMCISAGNEWVSGSIPFWDDGAVTLAHELGHQLGLQTHYEDIHWTPSETRDSVTPWDIMGLSPTHNHFLAWAKYERGFLSPDRVVTVGPPTASSIDQTVFMLPQEFTLTAGTQMIRVPFSTQIPPLTRFAGYTVESRQRVFGDEYLPNEGILVSLVDENPAVTYGTKAIVMDNPLFPSNLDRAVLLPQQSFVDSARNIRITHVRTDVGTATVRVEYGFPPPGQPNPSIIPWGNPPYETPDIWIDSELNGWGTYRFPDGNRDDAWVNHVNRVYFRVRNLGVGPASNVHVSVFQNDPPGLGDAGPGWAHLGTTIIASLLAGDSYVGYVNWTPTVARHTCLRVVIEPYAGESNSTDNMAQENVSSFDTTSSSPYQPVTLTQNVFNPFPTENTPVHILVRDIPKKWKWKVFPEDMIIPAGGTGQVTVTMFPPDPTLVTGNNQGLLLKPKIEAQVPFADSFITIGGTEMRVHLTYKCKLSCDTASPAPGTAVISGGLFQLQPVVAAMVSKKIGVDLIRVDDPTSKQTQIVTTNSTGNYFVGFKQLKAGKYYAKAYFAGTSNVQMQETLSAEFEVL